MFDSLNPGQTIRCTITGEPRAQDAEDTILRLMQRDPDIKRGLRRAQKLRRDRMHVYIRGGRRWYDRERCGKIARVRNGESWSMPYTPDIRPDLESVQAYVDVAAG